MRIREFESTVLGTSALHLKKESEPYRAEDLVEKTRSGFHSMRTEGRGASRGRGRGGRFVGLGHEGHSARAEEKRQKSLEYALKIGCSLDGDESEAQIQEAIQARKEEGKMAALAREERYMDGLKREARELGIEVRDWFTKDNLKSEISLKKMETSSKKKEAFEKRTREAAEKEGVSGASYRSIDDLVEELGRIRDNRRARRDEERSTKEKSKRVEQARREREYELYEEEQRRRDPHYDRKKKEREDEHWASFMQHVDSACLS